MRCDPHLQRVHRHPDREGVEGVFGRAEAHGEVRRRQPEQRDVRCAVGRGELPRMDISRRSRDGTRPRRDGQAVFGFRSSEF